MTPDAAVRPQAVEPPREHADHVVVSDVHMSLGFDRERGEWDRHEAFRHDEVLARFLGSLASRRTSPSGAPVLLLLGDLFDFLHAAPVASPPTLRVETSESAVLATLERIAERHEAALRALGRLAADGVAVAVVPGNHDVELVRPAVQERLRGLIEQASGRPSGDSIRFHPWIYDVPGVVYAEHGSQYHDLNAFVSLLAHQRGGGEGEADVPLGSRLTAYLMALDESLARRGVATTSLGLVEALRAHPLVAARLLPLHASFARAAVTSLASRRARADRRAYRSEHVRRYAEATGLPYETLVAIDELAALSPFGLPRRAARRLVEPLLGRARRGWQDREGGRDYLLDAARSIQRVLAGAARDVPFYLFGHSHRPLDIPFVPGRESPRYLNPGTWSSLVPPDLDPVADRFTFVEIARADGGEPTARLLRWDDEARCAVPYTPGLATAR